MRKIIMLLMLSSLLPLNAARWTPSAGVDILFRSDISSAYTASLETKADIKLLSLSERSHGFSLPLSVSYTSPSTIAGRLQRLSSVSFGAEAEYTYAFSSTFSLSAGAGFRAEWFPEPEALSLRFGGTIRPSFRIERDLTLSFPVSVYAFNGIAITIGAGIAYSAAP